MTDSVELQGWHALMVVHAEEAKAERDKAESGDGQVFDPRAHPDDDDEEGDDEEMADDGE